jgi:hypothetical protein
VAGIRIGGDEDTHTKTDPKPTSNDIVLQRLHMVLGTTRRITQVNYPSGDDLPPRTHGY